MKVRTFKKSLHERLDPERVVQNKNSIAISSISHSNIIIKLIVFIIDIFNNSKSLFKIIE